MKALITGANGQLGYDLNRELGVRGMESLCTDAADMDITDFSAVERTVSEYRPDVVFHCAAWTAVDAAEEEENRETVRKINALGTENVARACKNIGCKIVYISTDYVFDGKGDRPLKADCTDFAPLNVYGQTKLEGEKAVKAITDKYFIVRIAWVFGAHGKNFVKTMLSLGKKYERIKVVNDQIGTPTYTRDLARLLVDMSMSEKYGCYHATNEGGYISWYDFACEIFRQAGMDTFVEPVTSEQYNSYSSGRSLGPTSLWQPARPHTAIRPTCRKETVRSEAMHHIRT